MIVNFYNFVIYFELKLISFTNKYTRKRNNGILSSDLPDPKIRINLYPDPDLVFKIKIPLDLVHLNFFNFLLENPEYIA